MKKGPMFLIMALIASCSFMTGLKYGRKVSESQLALAKEYVEKVVPSLSPTDIPPPTYTQYFHRGCAIGFLNSNDFIVTSESTRSAELERKFEKISISCDPHDKLSESGKKIELRVDGKEIIGFDDGTHTSFSIKNAQNKKTVIMRVANTILPLVDSTFRFINE